MIGRPKYTYDQKVKFNITVGEKTYIKEGIIYIIDKYGTFFDNKDVSYDVFVEKENCLYKHLTESCLTLIE